MSQIKLILSATLMIAVSFQLFAQQSKPLVTDQLIFEEKNGIAAVEAELFYKQSLTEKRQWYIASRGNLPAISPDHNPQYHSGASQNSYVEILPDTRVTHDDQLIAGENFSNKAGEMAVLHYRVKINQPGRYYVWVRAFSTGSEDNGIHVGLNGSWPEHGQRMQWCEGKNQWTWASKQRTEKEHCGVPKEIYLDINKAGVYEIQFSMREDGFEMDKFFLTSDIDYIPEGAGPAMNVAKGKLPKGFAVK